MGTNRTSLAVQEMLDQITGERPWSNAMLPKEKANAVIEKYRKMEAALEAVASGIHTEGMLFPDGSMENKAEWTAKEALAFDPLGIEKSN